MRRAHFLVQAVDIIGKVLLLCLQHPLHGFSGHHHKPSMMNSKSTARSSAIHAHFANTFIQIHLPLHLTDLVNSELENSPFTILGRGLLQCDIKGPL